VQGQSGAAKGRSPDLLGMTGLFVSSYNHLFKGEASVARIVVFPVAIGCSFSFLQQRKVESIVSNCEFTYAKNGKQNDSTNMPDSNDDPAFITLGKRKIIRAPRLSASLG
jgi:hypothetical protein